LPEYNKSGFLCFRKPLLLSKLPFACVKNRDSDQIISSETEDDIVVLYF